MKDNFLKVLKENKIGVALAIIFSVILLLSYLNTIRTEKNTASEPAKINYLTYIEKDKISNPEYMKDPSNFIIDSDNNLNKFNNKYSGDFYGNAWVEQVLYFDLFETKKNVPHLLLSYTHKRGGENIISFYLQPLLWGPFYLSKGPSYIISDKIDKPCSQEMFDDMLGEIYMNRYVYVESFGVNDSDKDGDILIKKQDIDTLLLKGVDTKEIKNFTLNGVKVNDEFVSSRELLVTSGYASDWMGDGTIAKATGRGVWSKCSKQ